MASSLARSLRSGKAQGGGGDKSDCTRLRSQQKEGQDEPRGERRQCVRQPRQQRRQQQQQQQQVGRMRGTGHTGPPVDRGLLSLPR
eukprot:10699741-Alexandrium_andersonii.AAC.1